MNVKKILSLQMVIFLVNIFGKILLVDFEV
jgi:hypothetical protein